MLFTLHNCYCIMVYYTGAYPYLQKVRRGYLEDYMLSKKVQCSQVVKGKEVAVSL